MQIFSSSHVRRVSAALAWLGLGATPALAQLASFGEGDPPGRVARLSALEGGLSLLTSGSSSWAEPALNYTVTTGDRFYAPPGTRGELDMGSSAIRMGDAADLAVTALTDNLAQFALNGGTTRTSIYRWDPSQTYELDTPNGALMPRSAGRYRVSVDPSAAVTTVSVESGALDIMAPGLDRRVNAGQTVELVGTNPVSMRVLSFNPGDAFEQWALTRDRRFEVTDPSVQYVGAYTPGWEDLDDYGSWYDEPSYGPVWYPRSVGADWVPYREGRWAWQQPWGWTWVDNEPWGFAPFHYGRWARFSRGWGWVPGPVGVRRVYSPALVNFVSRTQQDPRDRFQAWFPLGPREPYFPWYRHSDAYLRRVNASGLRDVDVDRVIRDRDLDHYEWRNRQQALTAVRDETFRNGAPVSHEMLRVRADQMLGAHVAAPVDIRPSPRVIAGRAPMRQAPPPITHPVIARGMGTAPNRPPSQVHGNAIERPRMVPPQSPVYERPQREAHERAADGELMRPQTPPPPRPVPESHPVPSRVEPPRMQPSIVRPPSQVREVPTPQIHPAPQPNMRAASPREVRPEPQQQQVRPMPQPHEVRPVPPPQQVRRELPPKRPHAASAPAPAPRQQEQRQPQPQQQVQHDRHPGKPGQG